MDLTNRQKLILKAIVEEHVRTAKPVSSNDIIKKYLPKISSATIRNEMMFLEKKMFLEKAHVSSGRIPSISCYKYYEKTILEPKIENNIKDKLEKIFMQRYVSIDAIIDQSVSIINESLKLPSVVTITNSKCFLKRFDLIEIDKKTVLIILVTSDGAINKNIIHFEDNGKYLDDICTCVRIFNDRLVNTKVEDICKKIDSIKEIIRKMVHEYEFCIKKIIEKIFDFKQTYKNNLYGIKWLPACPEFQDSKKMKKILEILEDTNVWKHISYSLLKTGNTTIFFNDDETKNFSNNFAIASTMINTDNDEKRQLSIIGPTRMDYPKIKWLLDFMKKEIEKKINNK